MRVAMTGAVHVGLLFGSSLAGLSFVREAARPIAGSLEGFTLTLVATRATVPVGTGDEVERVIREAPREAGSAVVSNPECLRDGAVIADPCEAVARALDLGRLRASMRVPVPIDLRSICEPETARRHGFSDHGVGRSKDIAVRDAT